MIFDVELIFESERSDHDFGEELLEAFLAAAPGCDPVVDQNTDTGRTTVAFEVAAAKINAATARSVEILQHA